MRINKSTLNSVLRTNFKKKPNSQSLGELEIDMTAKIRVLVVCGSGIATTNMIIGRLKELCRQLKLFIDFHGTSASSFPLEVRMKRPEAVITASYYIDTQTKELLGNTPIYDGTPFLTGIGEKELFQKIIDDFKRRGYLNNSPLSP
jgi:galactitol-specific phosphotransferase system IIB component